MPKTNKKVYTGILKKEINGTWFKIEAQSHSLKYLAEVLKTLKIDFL